MILPERSGERSGNGEAPDGVESNTQAGCRAGQC